MTILGSWIDQGALSALADDLCSKSDDDELSPPPMALAAGRSPLDRLVSIREAAGGGGLIGGEASEVISEVEVGVEPFVVSDAPLSERLESFGEWAEKCVGGAHLFVVDAQGDPLVVRGGGEDVRAAAILLAEACRRVALQIGASPGETLRLDLENGLVLSILPIPTLDGLMVMGVRGSRAVSIEQAEALRAGIVEAVE